MPVFASCRIMHAATGPTGPTGPAGSAGFTGNMYALQESSILAIDPKNPAAAATIPLAGLTPARAFAIDPVNDLAYVLAIGDLALYDLATGDYNGRLVGATGATDIAYNPTAEKLYIAYPDNVEIMNTQPFGFVNTITLNEPSGAISVDPVHNQVYVTTPGSNPLVISGIADAVVASLPVSDSANLMAIDTVHNRLYVVTDGDIVNIVDTADLSYVDNFSLPSGAPQDIAVSPANNQLFINYGTEIEIRDAADGSFIGSAPAGADSMAVDALSNQLYYYNNAAGEAVIRNVETGDILDTISTDPVLSFKTGTREEFTGSSVCQGLFTAGSMVSRMNMADYSSGDYVQFQMTPASVVLGNNVTALDSRLFRINTTGIYEIGLRLAIDTSVANGYSIAYEMLVNNDAENPLYYRAWNQNPEQIMLADYVQLFSQLRANDILSVKIANFTSDDKVSDFLSSYITIRKIC